MEVLNLVETQVLSTVQLYPYLGMVKGILFTPRNCLHQIHFPVPLPLEVKSQSGSVTVTPGCCLIVVTNWSQALCPITPPPPPQYIEHHVLIKSSGNQQKSLSMHFEQRKTRTATLYECD